MVESNNDVKVSILKKYSRAIVHMRSQLDASKFGLVFGAGLSKSFGLPTWRALVLDIAGDPKINGKDLLKKSTKSTLPYQTQMLFEHFRKKQYRDSGNPRTREFDLTIYADWIEIIRKSLYKKKRLLTNFEKSLFKHPYLQYYLPIIRKTHLTVNYNFDDLIEQSLHITREQENGKYSRGYETVTNASLQFRSKTAIIYHPNGVVPRGPLEAPSDRFIFSEHEFADQLIDLFAGDLTTLLYHFSKNTCLFIGSSLDDQTLRSLLRQMSRKNPGHFHYYISYIDSDNSRNEKIQNATRYTNFKVYNLITLFMRSEEIAALGQLIAMKEDDFCEFAQEHGIRIKFLFYLTGPLGTGKSTAIAYFRNLTTYDEWLELRPGILSKPWNELSEEERISADNWILDQFRLKNNNLTRQKIGIFMIDRSPLDPLAFTQADKWANKAEQLLNKMSPGQSEWKVEPGCVILLLGDAKELSLRMKLTQRTGYTSDKLKEMEDALKNVYNSNEASAHHIDTCGLSASEVAQRIAEIVHLEEYTEINLHKRLEEIKSDFDS